MEPVTILVFGAIGYLVYRSHKKTANREAVYEVAQELRSFGSRSRHVSGVDSANEYDSMADAIHEAQASVLAKRRLEPDRAEQVRRQLLRSFDPSMLETLGMYQGTGRFSRCRAGLHALAADFENTQIIKRN